ncbi:LPS O-antigen length regulator [Glaciecola sp. XM2]|uniref:Wzz/FepE/Etk N-terminal domain-containing protein n=1 Tax=Glaciecola sp. XM2 TaxID=1914931 RepID=UPI001BDE25D5|nr:Wzz/FepE/Etk N-terminal domain-containing protein [Glaciecola sp. XM2]MBT1450693.1 LPS O-antigen length regulator [Glaciecola sp. XM2]
MSEQNVSRYSNDEEIDLRELFVAIWKGKWLIIIITFLFSVVAVFYAIKQPNVYTSQALLAPVEQDQSLAGLQGQLGGLASLAGINLGGGSSNKTQLAIEILQSRTFVSEFIEKYEILPDLMAVESWNMVSNKVNYDPELYDEVAKKWVRDVSLPRKPQPSLQEAYRVFMQHLSIVTDKETGMVSLSIEHLSPFVAKQWVDWLVKEINETMKMRDVEEAGKSTSFLSSQLAETKITDIREILYRLVEEQAKIIMFANVRDEYVFKTIDPALVPEEKSGPKRAILCVLGAFLGGVFGIAIALIKYFRKNTLVTSPGN